MSESQSSPLAPFVTPILRDVMGQTVSVGDTVAVSRVDRALNATQATVVVTQIGRVDPAEPAKPYAVAVYTHEGDKTFAKPWQIVKVMTPREREGVAALRKAAQDVITALSGAEHLAVVNPLIDAVAATPAHIR